MKVPYMPVIGDREVENGTIALRKRNGERQNDMPAEEFIQMVANRIKTRSSEL
jgi:threonyl-tRNA synthetase